MTWAHSVTPSLDRQSGAPEVSLARVGTGRVPYVEDHGNASSSVCRDSAALVAACGANATRRQLLNRASQAVGCGRLGDLPSPLSPRKEAAVCGRGRRCWSLVGRNAMCGLIMRAPPYLRDGAAYVPATIPGDRLRTFRRRDGLQQRRRHWRDDVFLLSRTSGQGTLAYSSPVTWAGAHHWRAPIVSRSPATTATSSVRRFGRAGEAPDQVLDPVAGTWSENSR